MVRQNATNEMRQAMNNMIVQRNGQRVTRRNTTGGGLQPQHVTQFIKEVKSAKAAIQAAVSRKQPSARANRRQRRAINLGARLGTIVKGSRNKEAMFAGGAIRPMAFAPRGLGYYDAFAMTPETACVSLSTGPATPIKGYKYTVLNGISGIVDEPMPTAITDFGTANIPISMAKFAGTNFSDNSAIIVYNCGSSDAIVGKIYRLHKTGSGASLAFSVTDTSIEIPQFHELGPANAFSGDDAPEWQRNLRVDHVDGDPLTRQGATGRVESIPLRLSVQMKNITESIAVGGEVRYLRYNGGLNVTPEKMLTPSEYAAGAHAGFVSTMDVNTFMDISTMMKDTERSHVLGAKDLEQSFQMNTYPADSIRSSTFMDDCHFHEAILTPRFCSLIIYVENFRSSSSGLGNTYTLGCSVQRAARFHPGSIHYTKQRDFEVSPGPIGSAAKHEANAPPQPVGGGVLQTISKAAHNPLVTAGLTHLAPKLGRGGVLLRDAIALGGAIL
jgi:hypothetical protein